MDIFLLVFIYSSLSISADFNIDDFFTNYFEINPITGITETTETTDIFKHIDIELNNSLSPIYNTTNTNQDSAISVKRKREENDFPKIATSKSPIFDALIILAHYEDSGVSFIGPKENGHLEIYDEDKLFINTNNITTKKSFTKDIKSRKKTYAQKFTISHDKNKKILTLIIKNNYIRWYKEKLQIIKIYNMYN